MSRSLTSLTAFQTGVRSTLREGYLYTLDDGTLTINQNGKADTGPDQEGAVTVANLFVTNVTIEAEIEVYDDNEGGGEVLLVARALPGGVNGYVATIERDGGGDTILSLTTDNASFTVIGQITEDYFAHHVRFVVSEHLLELYVDGQLFLSHIDYSINGPGAVLISMEETARLRNLVITPG